MARCLDTTAFDIGYGNCNKMKMNPKVDWFFDKATNWQKEYRNLRTTILRCGLNEELKWGVPCYTFHKNNVVLIHGFKRYCALLFHKGVLLKDSESLLVQQTKNVQATRQLRFTNEQEITELESIIIAYIFEAIEVEKAGLKVKMKETAEFETPEEFQVALYNNAPLRAAFEALTPGRQRGYLLYFANAKQSRTRSSRIKKYTQAILEGKGLKD